MSSNEVLEEISNSLFKLTINQQSEIIETALAKHIIILQNINPESQLQLNEVRDIIKNSFIDLEINNYFTELSNNISENITNGKSLKYIAKEFELNLQNIKNLTKNYINFEDKQKDFFNSLISNTFSANKDFVNDIVNFNSNQFYVFNVIDIANAKPLNFDEIKEVVNKDWQTSIKIEEIEKKLEENAKNPNFIEKLSSLYNLPIKKLEINKNHQDLPRNLIIKIFEGGKDENIKALEINNIYIANIIDVVIPNTDRNVKDLSLIENLRASFGNELLKNVEISTNDSLIDAVIDRY